MRREVMGDVRQLQGMLENHAKEGLPAADLQVIRRGKALEYFSRHYGKVYVDEGRPISVKDALVGINQLIDEDADKGKEPPPVNAEPMTRQFLRTFGTANEIKRDQLQKFLKGSITTPDEFVQRGWCSEKNKVYTRANPLDFARDWSGRTGSVQFSVIYYIYHCLTVRPRRLTPRESLYDIRGNNGIGDFDKRSR